MIKMTVNTPDKQPVNVPSSGSVNIRPPNGVVWFVSAVEVGQASTLYSTDVTPNDISLHKFSMAGRKRFDKSIIVTYDHYLKITNATSTAFVAKYEYVIGA